MSSRSTGGIHSKLLSVFRPRMHRNSSLTRQLCDDCSQHLAATQKTAQMQKLKDLRLKGNARKEIHFYFLAESYSFCFPLQHYQQPPPKKIPPTISLFSKSLWLFSFESYFYQWPWTVSYPFNSKSAWLPCHIILTAAHILLSQCNLALIVPTARQGAGVAGSGPKESSMDQYNFEWEQRVSLVAQMVKNPPSPGGGNGNPLQYSCLEKPMERGVWQAIQSMGSQKRWTRLSN